MIIILQRKLQNKHKTGVFIFLVSDSCTTTEIRYINIPRICFQTRLDTIIKALCITYQATQLLKQKNKIITIQFQKRITTRRIARDLVARTSTQTHLHRSNQLRSNPSHHPRGVTYLIDTIQAKRLDEYQGLCFNRQV